MELSYNLSIYNELEICQLFFGVIIFMPSRTPIEHNHQEVSHLNALPVTMAGTSATAFGEVISVNPDPQIQAYGTSFFDSRLWSFFSGQSDGLRSVGSGMGVLSIGDSGLAYSSINTKEFIGYQPGRGVTVKFACAFSTGVANSLQLAGAYHAEDGFGVGYNGEDFGVFHRYGRKLHIEKLSFESGSASGGDITITCNGTPNTVTVPALADPADLTHFIETGAQLKESGFLTLDVPSFAISGDLYLTRQTHGPITGSYSFGAGSTASSASFSTFQSGRNGTTEWTYQTGFSNDGLQHTGPSTMTIDPTKLNIYEIKYGWLGALPIKFSIVKEGSQELEAFHVIPWTNKNERPSVDDPRFPLAFSTASLGSTTPMELKLGSCCASQEGTTQLFVKKFGSVQEQTANTTETEILSISNSRVDQRLNAFNRRKIYIDTITTANESTTKAAIVRVYRGTAKNLINAKFRELRNNDSPVLLDTSATGVVSDGGLELIRAEPLGPQATSSVDVKETLSPTETLIITIQTTSSTAVVLVGVEGHEEV